MKRKDILFAVTIIVIVVVSACTAKGPAVIANDFDLQCDAYVEAIQAEEALFTEKINIPQVINGMQTMLLKIIDEKTVFVALRYRGEENAEFGKYDFITEEYTTCFELKKIENQNGELAFADENYAVFRTTYDNWETVHLEITELLNGNSKNFFTYTLPGAGREYNLSPNNICINDGKVYFDDIKQDESKGLIVDLCTYNIAENKLEQIMENAQNPFLYKDTVGVITQNKKGEFKVLTDISGEKITDITVNLMWFSSDGDKVFCIDNFKTDDEAGRTVQRVLNVITGKAVLATEGTISDINVNARFVSFTNYTPAMPFIYDAETDKLLVFNEIQDAETEFFIKDNYGIICLHTEGAENYNEPAYLFFSSDKNIMPNINADNKEEPLIDGLPQLSVFDCESNFFSEEIIKGVNADDINIANPWKEDMNIETFPVYRFDDSMPDIEKFREKIELPEGYTINNDGFAVIKVTPDKPIELPERYKLSKEDRESYDRLLKTGEYIAKNCSYIFGMDQLTATVYGSKGDYSIRFYEKCNNDLQQLINYCFYPICIEIDEKGESIENMLYYMPVNSPEIGTYEGISLDEAEEMLLNGKFLLSGGGKFPGKEYIVKKELVYRTPATAYVYDGTHEFYMPYYLFYVEMPDYSETDGIKIYAQFYVPAIDGKYIKN